MALIEAVALLQSMPPCTVVYAHEMAGVSHGHGSAAEWTRVITITITR